MFTKNFFPSKLKEIGQANKNNYDFSDSEQSDDNKNTSPDKFKQSQPGFT